MENSEFEKRRKGVEKLLKVIFWVQLIAVVVVGVTKILYLSGSVNADPISYQDLAFNIGLTVFLYVATRLAKEGNKAAGIIGIIIGVLELLMGGIIFNILGILLLIDSILFLVNFNKK